MNRMRAWFVVLALCKFMSAQLPIEPQRSVPDPGVITTRQGITPAGVPAIVRGRVYGVSFGASSEQLFISAGKDVYQFDWQKNKLISHQQWKGSPCLQGVRYDASTGQALAAFAVADHTGQPPHLDLFGLHDGSASIVVSDLGSYLCGALAVAGQARVAAVPLTYDNQLALIDLDHKALIAKVATAIAPFGAAINAAGTVVYVSNWGGRLAKAGDSTATTGIADPDEPQKRPQDVVVIDSRGIAATGTVTRIDAKAGKATAEIRVGLHPTAILWDEPRNRIFAANSNDDSVSVIDTSTNKVTRTITIQPFERPVGGVAPTALALTADGQTLFVACGGLNAVAQVTTATGKIDGLIPTGWYPASLSLSADGKYLAVGTLFGVGAGAQAEIGKRSVYAERGSVHVLHLPDAAQLAGYTTSVAENNHIPLSAKASTGRRAVAAPMPIPARSGDPSLIEHVVFIIKENRTYDQVLGDLSKGNGDPSLVMFGEDVTPNQHRLADQFVLLDNFYATGGVSGDGHQWLTQANETAYAMWPGYEGRSYPFDGSDPIAYSKSGFLWDIALARKKTVRVYGEFTPAMNISTEQRSQYLKRWQEGADFSSEFHHGSPIPPLNQVMAHYFPGYTNAVPDVVRAQIFLTDLKKWEKEGNMPNLTLLQLNCDHTVGTRPGVSTPKAMVADNDLALGRIVEALSRSAFWRKMAIFVVEDDAQNGVDHVDGHRTVALVVSPYTRRASIDSTFYSHQSILKSIELMLGLPTLSLFDLIANDMRNAFQSTPNLPPYSAEIPKQSLFEVNPPASALRGAEREGALASNRMRFDVPDAAPAEKLNRILWHDVRGWNVPYPGRRQAAFVPVVVEEEDDAGESK